MGTTMTLKELLEVLLTMEGAFILENSYGSMELRGRDFYVNVYNEWLTIYHATPKNPESQSHLHLKWPTLQSAVIRQADGQTPHLAFYGTPEPEGEALLIWYFPSFYDWGRGKAEIPANIAQYTTFITTYGTSIQLAALSQTP